MRRLIDAIASGRVDLWLMITHRFNRERIEQAYDLDLFSHQ
jgi:threonine dehydrogenase-like Zn-dependent dehydrogenase